jgi:type IV secretory pathway VirB6-like protein
MKFLYKNIILFISIFIVLIFFDYYRDNTFNWLENIIQSLLFVLIYSLFMWLLDSNKNK